MPPKPCEPTVEEPSTTIKSAEVLMTSALTSARIQLKHILENVRLPPITEAMASGYGISPYKPPALNPPVEAARLFYDPQLPWKLRTFLFSLLDCPDLRVDADIVAYLPTVFGPVVNQTVAMHGIETSQTL